MLISKIPNAEVAEKFATYPDPTKDRLLLLRQLILRTALELEEVGEVEETLKWGEPSYLTKTGSTIRIDWKKANPEQYAIYFNCKTTLVDAFKERFGGQLCFSGNRAIVLNLNDELPVDQLKPCVSLALTYHRVKHLPMLGV